MTATGVIAEDQGDPNCPPNRGLVDALHQIHSRSNACGAIREYLQVGLLTDKSKFRPLHTTLQCVVNKSNTHAFTKTGPNAPKCTENFWKGIHRVTMVLISGEGMRQDRNS